jgi:hypothetical protein
MAAIALVVARKSLASLKPMVKCAAVDPVSVHKARFHSPNSPKA